MGISTAAPSQLFPDSHENLILLGKSWRLLRAGGLEMDFFLAHCPSYLRLSAPAAGWPHGLLLCKAFVLPPYSFMSLRVLSRSGMAQE